MRQQIKCTKKKIADYWTKSGRLGADFEGISALTTHECFACRYETNSLERAHILADCLGGPATEDNLHLLCGKCHVQSELLTEETYWKWIISRRSMPKVNPILEYILKMKKEFGIDVFDEMEKAVEQAETVADMDAKMRCAILLPKKNGAPDAPITDKDKVEVIRFLKAMREFFKNGDMS